MLSRLEIENFKAFKKIEIESKKINIFIGEPNTGKTCLLEALNLFAILNPDVDCEIEDLVRFQGYRDLFYNKDLRNKVQIRFETTKRARFQIENAFIGNAIHFNYYYSKNDNNKQECERNFFFENNKVNKFAVGALSDFDPKIYPLKFKIIKKFSQYHTQKLVFPFGMNLPEFLLNNLKYVENIKWILDNFDLKLKIDEENQNLRYENTTEDIVERSFEYWLLPDTIQRYIFHTIAIDHIKNGVITIDTPESHLYPVYIKKLAERIAKDESNQFFISTHNPFFITTVLDRSNIEDVNVIRLKFEDRCICPVILNEEEKQNVKDLDYDLFFT